MYSIGCKVLRACMQELAISCPVRLLSRSNIGFPYPTLLFPRGLHFQVLPCLCLANSAHTCVMLPKKLLHFYNHHRCKSLILLVAFPLPRAQHMTSPHSRRKAEHKVDRCQHNHARFETRPKSKPPEKSYYFRCPWQSFNESPIFSSPFG
jgi:hypothetical protein